MRRGKRVHRAGAAVIRALGVFTDPAHEAALDAALTDLTEDERGEAGRRMCDLIELSEALEQATHPTDLARSAG